MATDVAPEDRVIQLGKGLPAVPERLLLAHARGEVLFICGAGISKPAGLPDFRKLVLDVYRELDTATHRVLDALPQNVRNQWQADCKTLNDCQTAEIRRFIIGDYDVVLGMLERRLNERARGDSRVRQAVARILRSGSSTPASIHKALIKLADRGETLKVVSVTFYEDMPQFLVIEQDDDETWPRFRAQVLKSKQSAQSAAP